MATKRQKRKRRRRIHESGGAPPPAPAAPPGPAPSPQPHRRAAPADGPPPAPWGSFPLSELVTLVALVFLVVGFFTAPPRGAIMIGAGLVLGSMAGLELSVREHFSGYRSHTLLLAGALGVAVLAALLVLTKIPPVICIAVAALGLGAAAYLLAGVFRERSGGSLFKFRA